MEASKSFEEDTSLARSKEAPALLISTSPISTSLLDIPNHKTA